MLDFNHVLATPGYDLQEFYGQSGTTLRQWQTWRKPRGVSWVYMIGVGGGGGGSTGGRGGNATGGGGGGGGSGGQSTVLIPAQFLPDVLYVQAGFGGAGVTTSGGNGVAGNPGVPTYVTIEPSTTLTSNMTVLLANGGSAGDAESTLGSPGGTGGTLATVGVMPLAGRGTFTLLVGQTGGQGGTRSVGPAPTALAYPATGLLVSGGQGGGGGGTIPASGAGFAAVTGSLGQDFYPAISAGAVAAGATPAGRGTAGVIVRKNLLFTGGTGGGGSSSTAGGAAGSAGSGAPGSGGGGAGAISINNTTAVTSGGGGPGFVIIISW